MDETLIYLMGYINALVLIYISNLNLQLSCKKENQIAIVITLLPALVLSLLSWLLVFSGFVFSLYHIWFYPKEIGISRIEYLLDLFTGERQ